MNPKEERETKIGAGAGGAWDGYQCGKCGQEFKYEQYFRIIRIEEIERHYIEGPRRSCSVTSSPNIDIMTTGKYDEKISNKSKIHLHLQ